jgi:hypothetical protein
MGRIVSSRSGRGFPWSGGLSTIRFMFLDGSPNQPEFTSISWEDFFSKFDREGLVLACEENRAGEPNKSYELFRPE